MNSNSLKRTMILMLILAMAFSFQMQAPLNTETNISILEQQLPLGALISKPQNFDSGYGIIWFQDSLLDPTVYTAKSESGVFTQISTIGNKSDIPTLTGLTRSAAEGILGLPINKLGNVMVSNLNTSTKAYYAFGDGVVILYYDLQVPDKVLFAAYLPKDLLLDTRFLTKFTMSPTSTIDTEKMTVNLLNQVRIAYGKPPLVMDEKLTVVSRNHSQTMVTANYFSHTDLSGRGPKQRIQAAKIPFRTYGEALTAGTWTPMDAITAWMNSPGHRAIILGDFTTVGIGIASGTSNYGIFFTLNAIKK